MVLAIVIFLAQLGQFGDAGQPGWLIGTFMQDSILDVAWLEGEELYMCKPGAGDHAYYSFLPALLTAVPSSLVAIAVVSGLVLGLDLNTKVVGDIASISGGLPSFPYP